MAWWVKADGTEQALHSGGTRWSLDELQKAVGGPIEIMPGVGALRLVMHEEARLLGLPVNHGATAVVHQAIATQLNVPVESLPSHVGTRLRYLPELRGDVLILQPEDHL